jgi:FkbM family methyltransferase
MNDTSRGPKRKSRLRSYTRKLRPRALWRSFKHLVDPASKYYGLEELDRKLEALFDYDDGYFVELGANDGVTQSNTLHLERHRHWRGVLVEPVPHNYLRCCANRSERNRIFCNACVSFDYKDRFVEMVFSNLLSSGIGLESDIEDPRGHAELGKQFLAEAEQVFTFGAVARPLNELLIEADAPRSIDLLSLDVEGAEMEVLRGVDHSRFRFKYMCIESRSKDKLVEYLGSHGYELVAQLTHHDYLFRDSSTAPIPSDRGSVVGRR